MTGLEKKLISILKAYKWVILYAVVTTLSMIGRFGMRYFTSGDMADYLRPWADQIKANGGLFALKEQIGNYGILYQTLIALMSYLPVPPEYGYKFLSMIFDYALGIVSAAIVWEFSSNRFKSFLSYSFLIMLPTVTLNSAAWAQCDSIYTFFCMLCFWFIMRERYIPAFIAYGCAFAFKLQAVFLAPFLIQLYLKERKFSIFNFLIIPTIMTLSGVAGFLNGRSILAPIRIYLGQSTQSEYISINYPSFWNMLVKDSTETFYQELAPYCIAFALMVLLTELLIVLQNRQKHLKIAHLYTAMVMSYSCVLLLPVMHDRYGYMYVIFGMILAVLNPKTILPFAVLVMLDLQSYGFFLFGTLHMPSNILGMINTVCFLAYAMIWGQEWIFVKHRDDDRKNTGLLNQ